MRYFPFIGYAKHLENPTKEEGLEDFFQLSQNPGKAKQTEEIIVSNGVTALPHIFLNDKVWSRSPSRRRPRTATQPA